MSKWSELASKNTFETASRASKDLAPPTTEVASGLDRKTIVSTDGREIPVFLDNSTRSVYPVRKA